MPYAIPALMAALLPSASPAAGPVLEPNGKWVVSGEEGLCVLSRGYGAGAAEVQIGIKPLGSEERAELVLVGPRDNAGRQSGRGGLSVDEQTPVRGTYASYIYDKPSQRITTLTVEADVRARMTSASTMAIAAGPASITVRLTSVVAALKALERCEDLMLSRWGVDVAGYRAETAHAKAVDAAKAYGPEQYPLSAVQSGAQGRTVAVLAVSAEGRATDCRVVATAGNGALDEATCRLALRRLRFTPARGVDGRIAKGSFVLPVRWILPSD